MSEKGGKKPNKRLANKKKKAQSYDKKKEHTSDKKKEKSLDAKKKHYPPKKKKGDPLPSFSDEVRLNKFIANAGICSRREADVLIASGVVEVNGKIVTEMGVKVKPDDVVKYDGATIKTEKKQYVLLNKPRNFITTMDDPQGRKTVFELVANACKERIYPVGRLDRNTTGLLMFTNDGDLAKKLTHPRYQVSKIYHVTLDKPIKKEQLDALVKGVELDDGVFVKADQVELLPEGNSREAGVELHSGKNRVVRRMFEAIGFEVKKLDRVKFASLTKKDLPRGTWRHLSEKEVSFLKMS